MTPAEQLDLWGRQWEAKHQAEVSQRAMRIGSDPEALANAMRRADRDVLETFAADLLAAESAESVRSALWLFTTTVARQEH